MDKLVIAMYRLRPIQQFCRRQYGPIFIRLVIVGLLPPKSAKSREIPRKFELIAVQGHPRSSTLVLIESAQATSY